MSRYFSYVFILMALSFSLGVYAQDGVSTQIEKPVIGADFYVNNSVGTGTFLSKNSRKPLFYSNLYFYPFVKTSKFWGERRFKLYGEVRLDMDWLSLDDKTNKIQTKAPMFRDVKLRARLENALNLKTIGFKITPAMKLELPTSSFSQINNRVLGVGANTAFSWSKWDFFAQYKPSITGYIHSKNYKSDSCKDDQDSETEQVKLSDGSCKISGQQTLGLLKNSFYIGYAPKNHGLTLMFRTYHSFLRPEKNNNNIIAKTLGILEYEYSLPIDFSLSFLIGLASFQDAFDNQGKINFPFFDFKNPASNNSEVYFALSFSV